MLRPVCSSVSSRVLIALSSPFCCSTPPPCLLSRTLSRKDSDAHADSMPAAFDAFSSAPSDILPPTLAHLPESRHARHAIITR